MQSLRVRCPKCSWVPDGKAHWTCVCGQAWAVFPEMGRCPACKARHETVVCPECITDLPLLHWYEDAQSALDELLAEEDVPEWLRYGDVR